MPPTPQTSVRARRVASELRQLREEADLTCTDVATMLGMSISKVSRMETANCGLPADDVAAMLGLYRVSALKRRELLDLLRRSDELGWWQRQAGLPQSWPTLMELESNATRLRNFENMLIPGLLQTAEYCRAMLQGVNTALSEDEVDHLVAARMTRQTLLSGSSAPDLVAVIDENALRRPVGASGIMRRQLLHLESVAGRPNVSLRVVQNSVGAYVGMRGAFMILEFCGEPDLAYQESHGAEMFLEEAADVTAHKQVMNAIVQSAVGATKSRELIRRIAAET
jgi:hypothetical protein